ncbi:MAG: RidA family protein [Oscillospiraceae bacterium]|nr:RidA family protein [Oscillospiraceae bacterium]
MKVCHSDKAPAAIGPYSQAMITGNLVFTSGQIPINPATGCVEADDIKGQATQVCENIKALLKDSGSDIANVVKTVCFLSDMANFGAFNEVYAQYFTSCPARSCVAAKELPKGVLVEVETIAELN